MSLRTEAQVKTRVKPLLRFLARRSRSDEEVEIDRGAAHLRATAGRCRSIGCEGVLADKGERSHVSPPEAEVWQPRETELRQLQDENEDLKRLAANLELDSYILQEVIKKDT